MKQPSFYLTVQISDATKNGDASPLTYALVWGGPPLSGDMLLHCGSMEELERIVQCLKKDLDDVLTQAREALAKWRARAEHDKEKSMSPSDIWRQMEQAPTEEAMFTCFNALSESKRLEVAEWVLTHVSMFKGRGPLFAEHYNIVSHTLDD